MANKIAILNGLNILAVSPISSYGGFNTSIHRIKALESLGCSVEVIDNTSKHLGLFNRLRYQCCNQLFRRRLPVSIPDSSKDGLRLVAATKRKDWGIIWLEKALTIDAKILKTVRQQCPNTLVIGFSPDDMYGRHNQSQQFLNALPCYDVFLTTKTYNLAELKTLGCPNVVFIGNGYDPTTFRPTPITAEDEERLGGDIGFIGSYEEQRAEFIYYLAVNGLKVRVWGDGWQQMNCKHEKLIVEGRPLYGEDFARACAAFKINLGFLRKLNRDQQTTRSVEIPACGGFMLAERTREHLELFLEGEEADFFLTRKELVNKCRYYLTNPDVRQKIANAGYQRCQTSRYSNAGRLAVVLPEIVSQNHQIIRKRML